MKGIRFCDRRSRFSGVQECSCREDCDEDTTVADSKRTLVVSRVSHQFAKTCRTLKDRGCNVGGRCNAPHTGGRAQHGSGVTIAISAWVKPSRLSGFSTAMGQAAFSTDNGGALGGDEDESGGKSS